MVSVIFKHNMWFASSSMLLHRISDLFLSSAAQYSIECILHVLLIYSPKDGFQDCLQLNSLINKAEISSYRLTLEMLDHKEA